MDYSIAQKKHDQWCIWLRTFLLHSPQFYQISEIVSTCVPGAAASIAVGHVALDWSVWGELVLGVFTALTAGVLYLMDLTNSIWICYGCYGLFKTIYMALITICT